MDKQAQHKEWNVISVNASCHFCTKPPSVWIALPDGRRFHYCVCCASRIVARYRPGRVFQTGRDNIVTLPA